MRLYKILFFLVSVILLSACKPGRPNGVLSPDQMVPLLVDIHLVDGSIAEVPQIPDSLYKYGMNNYSAVFKAHEVDTAQFRKSFAWYSNQPDEFYEIYDKVTSIIKAKSDSAIKVKARIDSLEQVKQNKILAARAKRFADSVKRADKRKADSIKKNAKADTLVKTKKPNKPVKAVKPKIL